MTEPTMKDAIELLELVQLPYEKRVDRDTLSDDIDALIRDYHNGPQATKPEAPEAERKLRGWRDCDCALCKELRDNEHPAQPAPIEPLEEALAWLRGERSTCNTFVGNTSDSVTAELLIIQADADMVRKAYWTVRAYDEGIIERLAEGE